MLVESLLPYCRLKPDESLCKGRGTVRLFHLESLLEQIVLKAEVHCNLDSQVAVAHPVSVSEVERRLPADCGTCDPQRYLRGDHLKWFQNQHLSVFRSPCRF